MNSFKSFKTLAVAAAMSVSLGAAAQQPIKIGFVAELSGPQGALGQDQYDGFMLVVERNGGKLGGFPVQVLKEDSQLRPEVANQIVDKLIEKEKVQIIAGVTFSNIMMTIYKKVTDSQVFLLGSNAGPSPVAGAQCSPFAFLTNQNDSRAEVMGKYAADQGYKRIYALAPNYQAGKDFIAGFKRYYNQPLVDEVYTPLNQLDFQAELARIAAARPDAVYVFYPGGLGIQFVRQWRQSGLAGRIPLLSNSTVDGINLPALQEAALGVVHGALWSPELEIPQTRRFVSEFEKRYKRVPSEYAATAYDSALMLDAAIAKVNGKLADKEAFRRALRTAEYQSVRGTVKLGTNQVSIQDFYAFEVIRDANGRYTYKTLAKSLPQHPDPYHAQCKMK